MLSPGAETLLRMVGWAFLPDIGSRVLLRIYRSAQVSLPPRFGYLPSQPPPPGTPAYAIQQRICFSVVIVGYLIWTAIQAYIGAPENFYQLLGVMPEADEATLKTAFRNFARYNHPDRVGQSGEAKFIAARDAFDTLKSSTRRYAYDRFGPEVTKWVAECTTVSDYIERGMMASCGFYIVTAVAMILYAIFGQSGFGAFWRYNLFFTLACLELILVLSPQSQLLTYLFPSRVPYQHVRLLHQVFISLSIAITRIGPAILPSFSGNSATMENWEQERTAMYNVVKHVTELAARLDREVSRMINMELKAIHGEEPETRNSQVGDESTDAVNVSESPNADTSEATLRRRAVTGSIKPLRPVEGQAPGASHGIAGAPSGAVELDNNVMRKLTQEVEDMVIEKNIRRHPMLARIWNEGVKAGRRAYQQQQQQSRQQEQQERDRAREDRLFGLSSQTTAVEPSQNGGMDEGAKREYVERRARSEGFSTPSPRSSPTLPTPASTHNHGYSHSQPQAQPYSHPQPNKPTLDRGPRKSSFPRPGTELAKLVEAERARIRETRLDRLGMSPQEPQQFQPPSPLSPSPAPAPAHVSAPKAMSRLSFINTLDGNITNSPGLQTSPSPAARLGSVGSVGSMGSRGSMGLHPDNTGAVSSGEQPSSRFNSEDGRINIRSRSISLIN